MAHNLKLLFLKNNNGANIFPVKFNFYFTQNLTLCWGSTVYFLFCRRPSPGCLRRGDPSENDKERSPEGEAEEHEHPHGQRFGVLAEESKLLSSKWDHRLDGDAREGLPTKRKVYLLAF